MSRNTLPIAPPSVSLLTDTLNGITIGEMAQIADNIARTILDISAIYQVNIPSIAPTRTTIILGQIAASSSLLSRIASLPDLSTIDLLAGPGQEAANRIADTFNLSPRFLYQIYAPFLKALDISSGGVAAFLASFGMQINSAFADAFNYTSLHWQECGLSGPMTQIDPANVFIGQDQTLANILISNMSFSTGSGSHFASTGGSGYYAIDPSRYAAPPLFLVNAKSSTTVGSHFEFTVQYLDEYLNLAKKALTLNSSALAHASYSLDIHGYSIENFTVQNVNSLTPGNLDSFTVVAKTLRVAIY